jgi:LysR family transcriptional regulator, hydrogen peroxide-inducible genes activator
MQKLTLRHLRYFDSLARNRHFGRAAEACAISQPALSLQMKELETLIGAPLIERGPRQVRLTALGEALVARARDILRAVDDLGDLARVAVSGLSGELRLGVIPTIAPYLLPYVITTLAERFEKLELRPQEAITSRLVDDLLSGTLDAAIVALPVSEPGLHEHPLFEEEFVLVRPLADADKPVPDPADLHEMRLLLLGEGHCFRDQALALCQVSPRVAREMMEGSSLATLVQMVGAGIGVTLIPQMAIAVETRSAPVSVARLPRQTPQRTVGMIWRRSNPLADQLREVAATLRDGVAVVEGRQ